jgi:uncharacterized protein
MSDAPDPAEEHACAPDKTLPPQTRALIEDFASQRRLAIVGVSASGKKFGNMMLKELRKRGYEVVAVHPTATEIAGEACYPDLKALEGRIDGAVICVPASAGVAVLDDAAEMGLKRIWLQQGSQSDELLAHAAALGLEPVHGRCILMYAQPVGSLHGVHRFFAGLFGGLWPKEQVKALPAP